RGHHRGHGLGSLARRRLARAAGGHWRLLAGVLGAGAGVELGNQPGASRQSGAQTAAEFPRRGDRADPGVYPDRVLWLAIVGNTWFWFYAALVNFNIP